MPAPNLTGMAPIDLGFGGGGGGMGDMLGQQQKDETEEERRRRKLGLSPLAAASPAVSSLFGGGGLGDAFSASGLGGKSGRGY